MIEFFVPGVPAPQGSKSVFNGVPVESSKKVKPWRRAVKIAAGAMNERIDGAVRVRVTFVMPRPKRLGKRKKEPMIQRPDLDKLVRSTFDGLVDGGVIADDSHVVELSACKVRAGFNEITGAYVTILGGDEDGALPGSFSEF